MTSCKWILLSLLPMLAHISLSSATELNSRSKRAPPFGEHAVPGNVSPLLPLVNAGNPARNAEPVADKPPQNADKVKAKKKEHIKIADSPECAGEVKRFCSDRTNSNNFLVLDCLQDDEKVKSVISKFVISGRIYIHSNMRARRYMLYFFLYFGTHLTQHLINSLHYCVLDWSFLLHLIQQ